MGKQVSMRKVSKPERIVVVYHMKFEALRDIA